MLGGLRSKLFKKLSLYSVSAVSMVAVRMTKN